MNLKRIEVFIFCLCLLSLFCFFEDSQAAITLPWSTSFDCDEYIPSGYGVWTPPAGCDNLMAIVNWNDNNPPTQIVSASSRTNDDTKGLRAWLYDGHNINSLTVGPAFTTGQREFWMRFYMRYQNGFTWANPNSMYHKLVYITMSDYASIGGFEFGQLNQLRAWVNNPSQIICDTSGDCNSNSGSNGWIAQFPAGSHISNGKWMCVEVHAKMDTNGSNGIAQMWIDGKEAFNATNVNWSNGNATYRSQGFSMIQISTNQDWPNNASTIGSPAYVDFDDIAISNTGYIGQLDNPSDMPPSAPKSLSVS